MNILLIFEGIQQIPNKRLKFPEIYGILILERFADEKGGPYERIDKKPAENL